MLLLAILCWNAKWKKERKEQVCPGDEARSKPQTRVAHSQLDRAEVHAECQAVAHGFSFSDPPRQRRREVPCKYDSAVFGSPLFSATSGVPQSATGQQNASQRPEEGLLVVVPRGSP